MRPPIAAILPRSGTASGGRVDGNRQPPLGPDHHHVGGVIMLPVTMDLARRRR
jgi:hypothetical protein